jgi:hypothetical protein
VLRKRDEGLELRDDAPDSGKGGSAMRLLIARGSMMKR